MSVADLHDLEFVWPSLGPTDVVVTGTFDQWSGSIHLVKGGTEFSRAVKVPWGEKVAYKFIVDGRWQCRDDRPQEDDGDGNINNVLHTPEKPLLSSSNAPARLSIPSESNGHGDLENMVTAVEYLPPPEHATTRGLFVPQISVQGLRQAPSVGSEAKLDTAAATEGHVSPSEAPAKLPSFEEAPDPHDVSTPPTDDEKGSVYVPPVNGNGDVHDPHSIPPHELTHGELPNPWAQAETAKEAILEPAILQPSPPATQDAHVLPNPYDDVPVPPPAATSEPPVDQPKVNGVETVAQGHRRRATSPAAIGQPMTPTPSTPESSTLTHKKRRSFFARIKHIFDKDKDKQGKKEKSKP